MPGIDDVGGMLVPPPSGAVRYGQGTIKSWDPETFENEVHWRGVPLRNLPILSGVDALTYRPGDTVGLLGWGSGSAAGSWWILGRLVIPGLGRAEESIAFMSTSLAEQISTEVLSARIHSASTPNIGELTGEDEFVDLSPAGPTISDVQIDTGVAIVSLSCSIGGSIPQDTDAGISGLMSVEVSGATSIAATTTTALVVTDRSNSSPSSARGGTIRATYTTRIDGLNAGLHTFAAKYSNGDPSALLTGFTSRHLVVIAL